MPEPLRLVYLHQHFSTPGGAAGTRSHAQAAALAAAGHAVTMVCGRYAGAATGLDGPFRAGRREGTVDGFRVVEYAIAAGNHQDQAARAGAFLHYAARAAIPALRPADLVIASSTPLSVVLPALLARRLRGTPFLFEMRDPWPELPRAMNLGGPRLWWAMDRVADAACRRAAAVVTLSEGMGETAIAHGAAPARVHTVPNGCDLGLFRPGLAPWRPPGIPDAALLAVYAGAFGPANGLELLVEAAARVTDPRVHLLLVGQGAQAERLASLLAGRANISIHPPLPKPLLARLLAGAAIGLQCLAPVPAFAEWTAPNKLMDYLAAGLPVVANTPGRAARLLASGPCGIVTPAADAGAMAAAIDALASDPGRRAAMGRAGRALAEARFDRVALAARFVSIVESAARM